MTSPSIERGSLAPRSIERGKLIVSQPAKLIELNELLLSLESLPLRVSERTGEDRSGDLGGAAGTAGQQSAQGLSPRDQAIAALPAPEIMQKKIQKHIEREISSLQRAANRLSRSTRPGSAFRLNELYSRIRRLNALLAELLEASYEILKRLFIRVFIDKQPVF